MIKLSQGNIFEAAIRNQYDLMVLFGSGKCSFLGATLMGAAREWPELARILWLLPGPYGQWIEYAPGQWATFYRRRRGIPDDQLAGYMREALGRGAGMGLRRVIMNGVHEGRVPQGTRDESNRRRCIFMMKLCREFEEHFDLINLISLDDDFVRCGSGYLD